MKHKLKLPETILFLSTHSSHVDPASSSETKMHFEIHRPTATTVQKKKQKTKHTENSQKWYWSTSAMNSRSGTTPQNPESHQTSILFVFEGGIGVWYIEYMIYHSLWFLQVNTFTLKLHQSFSKQDATVDHYRSQVDLARVQVQMERFSKQDQAQRQICQLEPCPRSLEAPHCKKHPRKELRSQAVHLGQTRYCLLRKSKL